MNNPIIARLEWRWVGWLALGMVLITGLPYVYGWLAAPAGTSYTGLHSLAYGDIPVYYSQIRQVMEGGVVAFNQFTSEPQRYGLFNIWWWLVGTVAGVLHLSTAVVFQLARLLLVAIFVFVAYYAVSLFFEGQLERRRATLLALLSGGWGVYVIPILQAVHPDILTPGAAGRHGWPIDLWVSDAITFSTLYQTSHFILSLVLLLLIAYCWLRVYEGGHWLRWGLLAGVISIIEFNFHPYYVPLVFGVAAAYGLIVSWRHKKIAWSLFAAIAVAGVLALPSIGYHVWILNHEPVLAQRAGQNTTLLSGPLYVLVGYGAVLLAAIVGAMWLWRTKHWNNRWDLAASWAVVAALLMATPIKFQSRYALGFHFVLCLFALPGIIMSWSWFCQRLGMRWRRLIAGNGALIVMLCVVFFGMTTIFQIVRDLFYFTWPPAFIRSAIFIPNDVRSAIAWLDEQPVGVVVASQKTALFVSAWSHQVTYASHSHETLDCIEKGLKVLWLYHDNDDLLAKADFLRNQKITHVLHGSDERLLGSFDPAKADFLQRVFRNQAVDIYRVIPPAELANR